MSTKGCTKQDPENSHQTSTKNDPLRTSKTLNFAWEGLQKSINARPQKNTKNDIQNHPKNNLKFITYASKMTFKNDTQTYIKNAPKSTPK